MKQCYLLLVLLSFSQLHAQQITYQPFHEGTTMWLHDKGYWNGVELVENYYRTIWSGDTLINGEHYTPIYRSGVLDPQNPMTYQGAIREEIANEQVFFVNTDGVEFDISISRYYELGDTIPYTINVDHALSVNSGFSMFNNVVDALKVTTVDSIQVNSNDYRIRYEFSVLHDTISGAEPYEVVVYEGGRGYQYYSGFEASGEMLCYKEEDSVIYGVGWELAPWFQSCLASIHEEEINVTISPNPSSGKFQLAFGDNKSFKYEVVDVYGKRIISLTDNRELDLTGFPSGIYIVCVSGFEGAERKYKIIKE